MTTLQISVAIVMVAGLLGQAQAASICGTAENFAVLAGSRVTTKRPTLITGDLGVSHGTSVTGRESISLFGAVHHTGAGASQASQGLARMPCSANLTGRDLGGSTLTSGGCHFGSSAQGTGATIHNGTVLAQNGAVALDTNTLSIISPIPNKDTLGRGLTSGGNGSVGPVGSAAAVPEPVTLVLFGSGMLGVFASRKKLRSRV